MLTITLKPFFHKGEEQIGLCFENDAVLNLLVKKIKGVRWSKTNTCWYLPLCRENYAALVEHINNSALIDATILKEYLVEKRKNIPVQPVAYENKPVAKRETKKTSAPPPKFTHPLSKENSEALQKFTQHLVLKAYTDSTIRTYTNELRQFLNTIK